MISTPLFVKKRLSLFVVLYYLGVFFHSQKISFQHGLLMPDATEDRESLPFDHEQSHVAM